MISLVVLDASYIIILSIIAYMSRKLGTALRRPPVYLVIVFSVIVLICSSVLDILNTNNILNVSHSVTIVLRVVVSIMSLWSTYTYWNWLLGEFFKKK